MKPRILLSGGGTGGSVTVLLALVDLLRAAGAELLFVGTTDGPERQLVKAAGLEWHSLPAGKLRRYASWQNVTDLARTWRGYRVARRIVSEWRPDVIVSAGSYVSVPLVWAARSRARILIHQQDVQPGLANRLMSPVADIICLTADDSRQYFPAAKVRVVGNPVRPEILTGSRRQAQQKFQLDPDRPTLLVIGGGTGSAALNQLVVDARSALTRTWNILHVTGHQRGPIVEPTEYYRPFAFLTHDLPDVLAAADLVVSRAGMGVLTELMAVGKPSIIIPMPHTHQEKNARFLLDHQAAVVLPQAEVTATSLIDQVNQLWRDQAHRNSLSTEIRKLFRPTAAHDMAELILQLVRP